MLPAGRRQGPRRLGRDRGEIERAYEALLPDTPEVVERYEREGEVPVIRNGVRGYEALDGLTLADLPAVLDALVVLEEEDRERERAEKERRDAERKRRERVRAKERRKLKALGEW